jgi:hypothetical protein
MSFLAVVLAATLGFHVEKISDGVYAAIRNNSPGLGADGTSVFIINDDDVVVVDTTGSLAGAREELEALRKLTSKPVRYVVNTHWHFDHVTGNQVYRDAFPNAEFIAHATTREDLAARSESSRKEMEASLPRFIADLRGMVEKKQNFAGETITDAERASYLSDIAQAEGVVAEAPQVAGDAADDHAHRPADAASRQADDRDPATGTEPHARRRRRLSAGGEDRDHR